MLTLSRVLILMTKNFQKPIQLEFFRTPKI